MEKEKLLSALNALLLVICTSFRCSNPHVLNCTLGVLRPMLPLNPSTLARLMGLFMVVSFSIASSTLAMTVETQPKLLIFVSSSMPRTLLKSYYREAAKYGGVLVFKGLPNGSFKELGQLITEMHGDASDSLAAGSIIDDEAFERFGIKNVPSFVLYKEEECMQATSCKITYDRLVGNIGVRSALEKFKEEGDVGE